MLPFRSAHISHSVCDDELLEPIFDDSAAVSEVGFWGVVKEENRASWSANSCAMFSSDIRVSALLRRIFDKESSQILAVSSVSITLGNFGDIFWMMEYLN